MTTASATKPRATRAGRVPRRLTDEELTSLMGLLRGADSTELKLTVPPASHRDTIQGLPIDPVESQPRQVYFFDTPDLALNSAGLVVRARRIQGGKGDTVIKLRPVDPADLSPEMRADASFNVEVDVLPGGYVCSASFKGRSDGAQIWDAVRGGRPLRKLFSKPQRAFFLRHAPAGIDLDALIPLGCGSIRTARGSSSFRRNVHRPRPSTLRPKRAPTLPGAGSCSPGSSRPRRERRSSSTLSSWRRRRSRRRPDRAARSAARSRGVGCGDS